MRSVQTARFRPGPAGADVSGLCSRCRHCRRLCFRASGHHASIFLRPFAPPALPGFVATMDALTPARRLFGCLAMNTGLLRSRSPCFTCRAFRPFRLQPPVTSHVVAFDTLPLSVDGASAFATVWASPFASRLAGRTRPNRVRHPTDWSFTSGCSPPRLAATQLRSVTGRRAYT